MPSRRLSRGNPLAFTPWPVSLITTTLYLALLIPILVIHNVVPSAPRSNPNGLDLAEAWADLQVLTNGYHPYNSHRNDQVRDFLLSRINDILASSPAPAAYSSVDEEKPAAFVFDDKTSNLTFSGSTLTAANIGVYFEGNNLIVYIRGRDDDTQHWWEQPGGVPATKTGGVLVNAHFDSVSTGFGATDDGVGVVTCLQLIRYFMTPGHAPRRGLVVLFNNGEEDFLNGARVFSQHAISRFPVSFLNLEGAGAGGRATLFRSSDAEVTRSYGGSKYPFGSVLSSDGFEAGFIASQTDYVVFGGNMGMRGLDVAFLDPRARYHTDQDDTRHTSRESLWHMLSAAVATTEGLVGDRSGQLDRRGEGHKGVWFDVFGSAFVVFRLHTLFALSVTLLIVSPLVLLITSVALARADKMYLFRSKARLLDEQVVSLQGLRGFFRFPLLFAVPTAVTVGLAFMLTKINPYIIHSSEYAVWSMMAAAWVFLAWFVARVADFARPSAFHRVYTLTWMFALSWVLLVVATVYGNRDGLAGGYFVFFSFCGVFLATWVSYLEIFALPRRSEYVNLLRTSSSRRASSHGGTGTASGDDDDDHEEGEEEEQPTESTSLLGGQRTTFANYVRVAGDHTDSEEEDRGDPNVYGREQLWSASMPKWTWLLQLVLTAPIVLIILGPVSLLISSALHQTGQDGGSLLTTYLIVAALSTLLFMPLLPFIHRHTHHVPTFLLAVLIGTLIYNLVAFPFSESNRLKLFFQQEVDLDSGSNRVTLTGVSPFVNDVASTIPSSADQSISCKPFSKRTQCAWEGPAPNVVDNPHTPMTNWVSFNITTKSPTTSQFQVSGLNTRSCRILFDHPISSFNVHNSATDAARFPISSPETTGGPGTKEIRLWSRTWDKTWVVDVEWPEKRDGSEDEKTGKVACIWSEKNQAGVIPALDEVRRYVPAWVGVSKLQDGLVEGGRGFRVD